jgi:hypothetical protein
MLLVGRARSNARPEADQDDDSTRTRAPTLTRETRGRDGHMFARLLAQLGKA